MNGSNPQLAQLSPKPLSGQSHGTAPLVSVNLRGRVTKIDTITGPSQSALTVFPLPFCPGTAPQPTPNLDRKSTRLNSSHLVISYAVFCLKKTNRHRRPPRAATARDSTPSAVTSRYA